MVRIENHAFHAEIALHGAELKKLRSKKTGIDYLWDGNGSWKRSAPVLFPNIGGLADEKFVFQGKEYPAPAHGFARDMDFALKEKTDSKAVFALHSNSQTATYFPFEFELDITYALDEDGLNVIWQVINCGDNEMYFSIGAHPGFKLLPDSSLCDYALYFDRNIRIETRRVIGRYLTEEKEVLVDQCNVLPLSAELMEKDAIILEDTGIQRITLRNQKRGYGLWIEFPDFPVVAVWTDPHMVKQAQFICLEPWCGINALCGETKEDISRKARVTRLDKSGIFQKAYKIGVEE